MSMVGQALAITATRLLSGRTWAGTKVLEQPIDPITTLMQPGGTGDPVLAVYVQQVDGDPRGMETQAGSQKVTLKVVAYVPPAVTVIENGFKLDFDQKASALVLNALGRQTDAAFHHGNDAWVALFRRLVVRVTAKSTRFLLIEVEESARIPCSEITYELDAVPEPGIGAGLFGAWSELDALLRADNEKEIADVFERMLGDPEGLSEPALFQTTKNLSDAAFRATGLAPLAVDADGKPVPLRDVGFVRP